MKVFCYNHILVFLIICVLNAFGDPDEVCPKIITRKEWGAKSPKQIEYAIRPVKYVIIHHTVTPECQTQRDCINRIFNIQSYHMNEQNYADIGYNFLIGAEGSIYEGIGWHKVGAHSKGYNDKSIGVSFIGNYDEKSPSAAAVRAAQSLLECGVALGELEENYKLLGARQVRPTTSPGLKLYQEIQTWSNWASTP